MPAHKKKYMPVPAPAPQPVAPEPAPPKLERLSYAGYEEAHDDASS